MRWSTRTRRTLMLTATSGALLSLGTGCTTEEAADGSGGAGGSAGGSAGSAQGGMAGATGGQGGAVGGQGGMAGAMGGMGGTGPEANCGSTPAGVGVTTNGICADQTTIRQCVIAIEADVEPQIVDVACETGEVCDDSGGLAQCVPTGDCRNGETECLPDNSTLRRCENGAWVESACGQDLCLEQPGLGASCLSSAPTGGTGIFIEGQLLYEFLPPNDATEPTQYDAANSQFEGAGDMFITVFDNNELIGMDLTKAGLNPGEAKGDFSVEVDRQPGPNTQIFFWPMLFDQQGDPFIAMARARDENAATLRSDEYWVFGFDVCEPGVVDCTPTTVDVGGLGVDEASGSGAIHIYDWLVFGFFRTTQIPALQSADPLSLAVFWQGDEGNRGSGIKYNCGNCFIPANAEVEFDSTEGLTDTYQSGMMMSGRGLNDYDSHWSRSTINHEFGHWVMSSFSISPGEGGPHFVDAASRPGLAYSEGFATFMGQSNLSGGNPANGNPVYFTVQNGTGFWVNLNNRNWLNGPLEDPNPGGGEDQDVNENVIGAMMWSLWASANAQTPQGLGEEAVLGNLRSERTLMGFNRGYPTIDFMDYLDALSCSGLATDQQISAVVDPVGYPWTASGRVNPPSGSCN